MIRETQVEIGRRRVRYIEAGAGWPVVLLHAFPLNAEMWRPQLEHAPRGWRIIAPDLRGFSAPPPGAALVTPSVTMDDYAADVDALLDHLEIEAAVIGGLSMGGYVTFALHRLAPQRFTAMILADTRPQADTPDARDGRRQMIDLLNREGIGAVADRMLPKLLGATTREARPEIAAQARAIIEAVPAEGVAAALQAMMTRPDSTADLATIACPALVIAGAEDLVTPVGDAEAMQRQIARSRLVVIPAAGHLSNLDAPETFSTALEDFLSSNI